jgi:hypothetical protein
MGLSAKALEGALSQAKSSPPSRSRCFCAVPLRQAEAVAKQTVEQRLNKLRDDALAVRRSSKPAPAIASRCARVPRVHLWLFL